MDLGTVITALIMLAVCVLPFVLMNRKKQKRIKHLKQTFTDFAKETNNTVGELDVCGGIVIGLDQKSNSLFFVKEHAETTVKICIELEHVIGVSLEKPQFNGSTSFEKIVLNFSIKNNPSKLIQLFLFDEKDKMQLDGELQLAEKWQKKLQEVLKSKKDIAA